MTASIIHSKTFGNKDFAAENRTKSYMKNSLESLLYSKLYQFVLQ